MKNPDKPRPSRSGPRVSSRPAKAGSLPKSAGWTFLTNHAHVLICIARDPLVRLRDVAVQVGITERAVQKIVEELKEAGYLKSAKVGRRNQYQLELRMPLRHPIEKHRSVQDVIVLGN
jgi:hypothetical protein